MLVGLLRLTPWATMSKLKISTVNDRERNLGERWCLYICLVKRLTKINNTLLWKATLVPCCDVRSEYFDDKLFRDKLEVCKELVRCDVFRAFLFYYFFFFDKRNLPELRNVFLLFPKKVARNYSAQNLHKKLLKIHALVCGKRAARKTTWKRKICCFAN